LPSNQARRHASADDALEHAPKDVAVTETLIAGTRERRVIRNLVLKAQATEPSVSQVDPNVPTQRPLRSNGKDVADDEHPDHQHRIDRWATETRVVRRQLAVYPRQIEDGRDRAHHMIFRNHLLEVEAIEKLLLVPIEPPHHRFAPADLSVAATESLFVGKLKRLLQQNRP
jgi:predicted nucleotidyltransferase component of viral defense system